MSKFFLGLDASTQSMSAVVIDHDAQRVVYERSLNFERDLPKFGTRNGVLPKVDPLVKQAPLLLWVDALDQLIARMCGDGVNLGRLLAISGSGQQHGSIYLNALARRKIARQDSSVSLAEGLSGCFARDTAPMRESDHTAQTTAAARLRGRAFTLVELLVVMAVITVLLVLVVPAVNQIGAKKAEQAFYDIAGSVENARAYAMANNTYVYLGFAEYDGSKSASATQTTGVGRVIVVAIASRDGTRGYVDTSSANAKTSWQSSYAKGTNFAVLNKPAIFENTHLAALGAPPATGTMVRPDPGNDAWRVGSDVFKSNSQISFSLPLGSDLGSGKYNFDQVLIFLPNGSVCLQTSYSSIGQVCPPCVEIGIQPTVGNAQPNAKVTANYAAVSINGTTGAGKIYRP